MGGAPGALGMATPHLHLCLREDRQAGVVRSLFHVKSLNVGLTFLKSLYANSRQDP